MNDNENALTIQIFKMTETQILILCISAVKKARKYTINDLIIDYNHSDSALTTSHIAVFVQRSVLNHGPRIEQQNCSQFLSFNSHLVFRQNMVAPHKNTPCKTYSHWLQASLN